MSTFKEVIKSEKPVLVDFHATWCGPCQTMAPVLKEVKSELGDRIRLLKVDIDKNPQAAHAFKVRGVPTFILFKEGKAIWRQSGIVPRTELVRQLTVAAN
ncbi:MAG: thioredoxin [Bacteroidota bacterium]